MLVQHKNITGDFWYNSLSILEPNHQSEFWRKGQWLQIIYSFIQSALNYSNFPTGRRKL